MSSPDAYFEARQGKKQLEKWEREYKHKWLCKTNNKADTPAVVLAYLAGAGYDVGHAYSGDAGALCKDINVTGQADDPTLFEVEFSYSSSLPDPDKQAENPLDRPTIWSIDTEQIKEYVLQDITGKAFTNSANDPFPPFEIGRSNLKLKAERNRAIADFDIFTAYEFYDNINADPWKGFPAKSVKLDGFSVNEVYENGSAYLKVNYTFTVKVRKYYDADLLEVTYIGDWNPVRQLDKGYNAFLDGPTPKQVLDAFGHPKSKESLLDGNGFVLEDGDPPTYIDFTMYEEADFNDLDL